MALVASGYGFCPRCGAAQGLPDEPTIEAESNFACPGCSEPMSTWTVDPGIADGSSAGYRGSEARIRGCRACGGAWVDRRTLDEMIARARASATAIDPSSVQRRTMALAETVVYRKCPSCGQQMNRRNFARYSGVVVDECRTCGTYFDAGELEAVFAFVRTGGLALRQQREAEELARERERSSTSVALAQPKSVWSEPARTEFDLLVWFLRWVGRWLINPRRER